MGIAFDTLAYAKKLRAVGVADGVAEVGRSRLKHLLKLSRNQD